jgi:DEAD/DEAH box helicase domain-containing protein
MLSRDINAAEAIHAAQHAFLNRFPMAADLKTECKAVRMIIESCCDVVAYQ